MPLPKLDDRCTLPPSPRPGRLERVLALLTQEYGPHTWRPRGDPLSELIQTILSQHTSDKNSGPAFDRLRSTLGSWEAIQQAPVEEVAEAIHSAGLANVKAPRIQAVLAEIQGRRGSLDLSFLAQMDLQEAKAWLRSLPGVGPKTAGCVLLFSLGRPALPVDTHVHRVSRRLGLIGQRVSAEQAHDLLEAMTPPDQVYHFHVSLIAHGRRVCLAQRPRCPSCILRPECSYYELQVKG